MNRRDKLLQEMGISQWQLRQPNIFKGLVNVPVAQNIRLIVIAEQALSKEQPFLQDVFRGLEFSTEDCLCIDFDFLPYLQVEHEVIYWLLTEDQQKIDRTLVDKQGSHCWKTCELEKLTQSPHAKRQFWQQIQGI
ncbi:DNA polymerase III subunit psi [Canicola haemoglobinophilus]|uniref:DNA polymerase III subunit psi n=1 Tax=Canicola haemoglobinophilus TaxID=733 RepID=A0A1V4B1R8_9PAST|nr:DNA polymerase III subunit psi [Canicola haemoglobinophilus]OOS01169.1 DNA polymerase III subunit psi [Canicola haemoglobinophilus]STO61020.1 DNA polymerase III subunit psi [Canicola haemoglobinophilus]